MLDIATQKSFQERFRAIRMLEKKDLVPAGGNTHPDIRDAGKNSFFCYLGHTYFVKDLNRYEETSEDYRHKKGYFIYELTCLCLETGQTVNFEWEFDDVLEVSMTLDRLSFRNLKDEEGTAIDEDDLDQIVDDRDVIVVNGENFWYEDDWAAIYYRGAKEEKVYMYEFENETGTQFLTIEEWSGSGREEYQVYTSAPIDPNAIIITSKKET
ncbi:MAG: DUF4178 domain-containing protein [Proteobacteria bacterium]|nr:DUF4178 domain-containing protein [Pseudomonadota bacterium]MBU1386247.1 DUF4178 domain-containing protein [Pseudomonadota bacterium]MBU1542940.1 DUF4178 domain-containing protein [Pseudomonadota bacterium]MBU2481609.1 DUF4178 domain-containing protein [Pseudomonadota bacterium]